MTARGKWWKGGWILLLPLGTVNAACGGYKAPVVNVRTEPEGEPRPVEGTPLRQIWVEHAGRGLTGSAARNDTIVLVGGSDRRVVALDLRSGAQRWATRLQGPVSRGVLLLGDTVYAGTERPDGQVYALDLGRGTKLWDTKTGYVASPVALAGGVLVVQTHGGLTVALNRQTGQLLWRRRTGIGSAPAMTADSTILVTTVDSVFRLHPGTGKVLSRQATPGTILHGWVPWNGLLLSGSTDSLLVAMDPANLMVRWRVRVNAPVMDPPAVRDDTAWVVTRTGTVYRVRLGDGVPRAQRLLALDRPATSAPVLLRSWLVLGGADGTFWGVSEAGRLDWQFRITGPLDLTPLPLADGLIAIGGHGNVHRYAL